MKALFTSRFSLGRHIGAAATTWVTACLLAAGAASAQTLEILADKLSSTYGSLKSFSVTGTYHCRYADDFVAYRREAGYALKVPCPSSSGVSTYFAKGSMFGGDSRSWWGDGKPMAYKRQAWDGQQWQRLIGRETMWLEIARRRHGAHEVGAHSVSPLEWGFPFLITASQRRADGNWPEDDYAWKVTLDKLHDKRVWQSFTQRLKEKVVLVHHRDQLCWKFSVESGFARGSRTEKIHYRVWFPVDAPVYPARLETWTLEKPQCLGTIEVTEFFDAVDMGSGIPLRFPKKLQYTSYTTDPLWLGKVVKVEDWEFTECTFNPPLSDDAFKIDFSHADVVRQLDTGQTIFRKK